MCGHDRPQPMRMSLERLRNRSGHGQHEFDPGVDGGEQARGHLPSTLAQEVAVQRDELRHIGDRVLGQSGNLLRNKHVPRGVDQRGGPAPHACAGASR